MSFIESDVSALANAYADIKDKWFLLTAEKDGKANTMTCSWGFVGNMWNRPTFMAVVRKSRYTKQFIDGADRFSVCFFEGKGKELSHLGSHSGRDGDKISRVGFTLTHREGVPYFEEAQKVLICTKNFTEDTSAENILDKSALERWYSGADEGNFHTIYFGAIDKILIKE